MKKLYLLIITAILYLALTGGMSLAKDSDADRIFKENGKAVVEVIAYDGKGNAIRHGLGVVYSNSGMYKKGVEAYKQILRINPDNAEVHFKFGVTYHNLHMYNDAIQSHKL